MSVQDYQMHKAAFMSIDPIDLKIPSIPVEIYILESEKLYTWALEDKTKLEAAGLDWAIAETIPTRAGALREAQSRLEKKYKTKVNHEKEWLAKSLLAFEIRDTLLNAFRYAFRDLKTLIAKTAIIAEGVMHEDMIQDLSELSVLGKNNNYLLKNINFDESKLDTAAQIADYITELLNGVKKEENELSEKLEVRNRVYTLLKEAVDEVKGCGKYVFWNNQNRLKGYRSAFYYKNYEKSLAQSLKNQEQEVV